MFGTTRALQRALFYPQSPNILFHVLLSHLWPFFPKIEWRIASYAHSWPQYGQCFCPFMGIFAPNTEVFGSRCPLCPKHEHLAHFQGIMDTRWGFFAFNGYFSMQIIHISHFLTPVWMKLGCWLLSWPLSHISHGFFSSFSVFSQNTSIFLALWGQLSPKCGNLVPLQRSKAPIWEDFAAALPTQAQPARCLCGGYFWAEKRVILVWPETSAAGAAPKHGCFLFSVCI